MFATKIHITPQQKKWLFISLATLLLLLTVGFIYYFSVRQSLLDRAMARVQTQLKADYGLTLRVEDYGFAGISTVELHRVSLIPDSGAQLMEMQQLQVSVEFWPLLRKRIKLDAVGMDHATLTMVKDGDRANYDFLFSKKATPTADTTAKARSLAQTVDRLIRQAFDKIPSNLDLNEVYVTYQDSSGIQGLRIPEGKMRNGRYDVDVFLNEVNDKWNLKGRIDGGDEAFSVTVTSDRPDMEVPFLRSRLGLAVRFKAVTFDLKEIKRHGKDQLKLAGNWEVDSLQLQHRRLSEKPMVIPAASAEGGFLLDENSVELLENSAIQVRDFVLKPQLKYTHTPNKLLQLAVHTGKFAAQDFFDAIPHGLFETLDGLKVKGDIAYQLDFKVDFDKPEDLVFQSRMDDRELQIVNWGKADVAALNQPFVHGVYEDTTKLRDILVAPANPNFRHLTQIAPILQRTVLNTEDPFFYKHHGFEEEAFKLSIVTNIKERAFKRGASTISMQLVKNLYLDRNKTMTRKFEEILLVWLMERSQAVSKDRLFEIYLNIIEWGKNVYGITEAAKYYFGKTPDALDIGESLFLSSIIPRPKTGLASFDYTGHLKPWVRRHFNTYGYILSKLNQLNDIAVPEAYGFYSVTLQPNLRPPRPYGVVDSVPSSDELHDLIEGVDVEEQQRRSLLERIFGKKEQEEIED
ncbi:transglycosylase domain-containing protein [Sphingobacterium sp. lm-10]|uniref:transglycosylase domain-containing protein n=1 Tax=Sphingobacterium sp. lm-10 TaxID=2944904 RepID=UPI0020222E73|nr:transglycosylase domain-containing protein [Sphingobacterium sp. lm-10]MCL7989364.1 transglycosylase domain-containing protein [Sphingobacterium sp. lm-10]